MTPDMAVQTVQGQVTIAAVGRSLLLASTLLDLAFAGGTAAAQSAYPNRTIEIVTGFPPGTSVDIIARAIGDKVQKSLGQTVLIKNVVGASGNLAADAVVKSEPSGHTLLLAGNASIVVNQHIFEKLNYDPLKDLAPIYQVAITPNILVVNPSLPAKTLQEFVEYARAQPEGVSYGHAGVGTSQHLAAVFVESQAKIKLRPIPYRGGPAIYSDLLEGRIGACFCNITTALPLIQEGKLRALAITSLRRSPSAPEIPTLDEAGFKGVDSSAWFGFMAPAGTPPAIIDRLHREIQNALTPEVHKSFAGHGIMVIDGSTPSEFAAQIKTDSAYWEKVVKANNIKVQ
jgi:tripartite-type tricarboxylate transporter receptor subunit TctC